MALILAIAQGNYNSVLCGFDPAIGEVEVRTASAKVESSRCHR